MENPPVDRAAPYSVPGNKPTPTHRLGRSWFPRWVGTNRGSNPACGIVFCLEILWYIVDPAWRYKPPGFYPVEMLWLSYLAEGILYWMTSLFDMIRRKYPCPFLVLILNIYGTPWIWRRKKAFWHCNRGGHI
jgi:hypothetical protein